jgi:hypothetical protein
VMAKGGGKEACRGGGSAGEEPEDLEAGPGVAGGCGQPTAEQVGTGD